MWSATEGIDLLLWVDGTDNMYEWSGGITTLKSTTSNTITKNGTNTWAQDRFLTAGTRKVVIGTTEYTYTGGETTTALTGVTPNPTGEAADSNVFQAVRTNANTPAADFLSDFLRVLNNQVYVGSTKSRVVYVSANDDFTDYTFSSVRKSGEGATLTLDNAPTAFARQDKNMYVSAGRDDWYRTEFTEIILSDDTLAETLNVKKLKTGVGMAARSQDLTSETGNFIAFIDFNNNLRILGNIERVEEAVFSSLSDPIKPDFNAADFTNGTIIWNKNRIYISTPNDDKVYILEIRESAAGETNMFWQPPQILPVRRFAIIGEVLYGHSNAVPETYKLFDGTSDRKIAESTNTSATSPGTMADDDSVGTETWSNPDNAKVSDDSDATIILGGGGGEISHYLKATNFGFDIPSGTIINGILVSIERSNANNDPDIFTVLDSEVKIIKEGTIGSTNKADTETAWTQNDAYVDYGSSSDLWGESWTPAQINASNFGMVISATSTAGFGHIDHIRITVYHSVESKIGFKATAAFSYRSYKNRDKLKNLDEWMTEGYISANTELALALNYDFEGSTQQLSAIISGADESILFQPEIGGRLGTERIGTSRIGAGRENVESQNPKFKIINTFVRQDFFEIQAIYETDEIDAQWELISHGGNIAISKIKPISIKK